MACQTVDVVLSATDHLHNVKFLTCLWSLESLTAELLASCVRSALLWHCAEFRKANQARKELIAAIKDNLHHLQAKLQDPRYTPQFLCLKT